jgi:hypothetical protein
MYWRITLIALLVAVGTAEIAEGQRFGRRGRGRGGSAYWTGGDDYTIYNVPYDGRFTFVRLSFTPSYGGGGWGRRGAGQLWWDHDWPTAERNLMQLVQELTSIRPYLDGSQILAADDPELHKYPLAYVSEPGYWTVNEAEAEGLRSYLLKGGFLIFDDFSGPYEFLNLQQCMAQVLPDARIVPLDASHPIFRSFFSIDSLELRDFTHPYEFVPSEFWGVYEDNDPDKRLMAIINYNNDIGELWEFSATGWFPVPLSNSAYKLGINYIVYAMTH